MRATYSQVQITKVEAITRLIGDHSNMLIMYELHNFGEKSFNELKRMTNINAVTLSKKLACLKEQGYVDSKHVGMEHRYFITDKAQVLKPLIREIERLITKGGSNGIV